MITKKLFLAGVFSTVALFTTLSYANHQHPLSPANQKASPALLNQNQQVSQTSAHLVVKPVHYHPNRYPIQGYVRPMPPRGVVVMNHRPHARWYPGTHHRPWLGFHWRHR